MKWTGGEVEEVSKLVRTDIDRWNTTELKIDRAKRRIVGTNASQGETWIYDKGMGKFFYWNTSSPTNFRWTSRTILNGKHKPFSVRRIQLTYDNTGNTQGVVKYQLRGDDGEWTREETFKFEKDEGTYKRAVIDPEQTPQSREFTMRLTSLSSTIRIHRVDVQVLADTFEESPSE